MFIVLADVKIKAEKLDEFKKWFSESNDIISKFDGFVSRRFLETKDGEHKMLVEFDTIEKFNIMHQSPEHDKVRSVAISFMDGMPSPKFYHVASQ